MSTTLHALNEDETTFLHEEIFVRRVYMQHGVTLAPPPDDPHAIVVVDCINGKFQSAADGAQRRSDASLGHLPR